MSTTIDQKVVEMRFDNKNFESNVSNTMSTLDKLKSKLNLTGAAKGLENINTASKRFNISGLGTAVDAVQAKFSALGVIGVTALANITNSAVNAGKRIISALTIDPIKSGFQEYETQMNAVQTILANTQSKGSTLNDVNKALDTLNTYADKTIYNFTEMTKNIGTFTAAGIDLDTSVSAIQGIANLAAVSGSTSQQASTAMYQLSQALASGTVKLMDWNSVVNAGMGGEVFQNALKKTSELLGTGAEAAIEAEGSFRESLKEGWLTSEVLTETLKKFTASGANEYVAEYTGLTIDAVQAALDSAKAQYGEAEAVNQASKALAEKSGKNEDEIKEALQMARTAEDAATKVKTFSQLWDTLKESAQSGWTQTWEIVVGDFEEAKDFLTRISDSVGGMIGAMSDSRNKVLAEGLSSGWKQLLDLGIGDEAGYKEEIKNLAKEHGIAFDQMIEDEGSFEKALKKSLKTGQITSDMLSESVSKFSEKLSRMSAEEREAAGYTVENVQALEKLDSQLKDGTISMDEFAEKIIKPSGRENLIESLFNSAKAFMTVITPIKEAFREIFPNDDPGKKIYNFIERLRDFTANMGISSDMAEKLKRVFKGLFSIFDIGRKVISTVAKSFVDLAKSNGVSSLATSLLDGVAAIGDYFTSLNEKFNPKGLSDMLSSVVSGVSNLLEGAVVRIKNFGNAFSYVGEGISKVTSKIWNAFKIVFGFIRDNISAGDIFAGLAGGGIFVAAKKLSSLLDGILDTVKGFFGKDGEGLKDKISGVLDSLHDSLLSFSSGIKVTSLVSIAIAVGILTASLRKISELNAKNIGKSLFTIGSMLGMLSLSIRSITKSMSKFGSKGLVKSGISLILVAKSIDILADVMKKISDMRLKDVGKGLIGIGAGLIELSGALKIIGKTKISLSTSVAMLALAESCNILGDAIKKFADMTWEEIGKGLSAMGGALGELVASISILNKFGGGKSIFGSIGILIAVQSLEKMSDGLKKFADMTWEEIKRGLSSMGGALGELALALSTVGKISGFSSIFASGAIWITVQSLSDLVDGLQRFASMTWEEIKRGLSGMGGALTEVAAITGILGKFTGFSGILGSGAIFITVQSLNDLANGLQRFADMSWDEIKRGLVGMGGALTEVATITGLLGGLGGFASLIGSGSILLAVQGLGDLADAFKKFGEMSWDEIERGLSSMGGALGEIALGGFLNTLSLIGAASISEIAAPLGTLADSVKKWADVTVPENLGYNLAQLGAGVQQFTFGGFGASALATAAPAVGIMADSVKKWSDVTIPENLASNMSDLADAIKEFTFSGIGSSSMAIAAPALGTLADSIKKWSGVVIPEGIESGLTSIANGVKAFSWAFMSGWSIEEIVEPLGDLVDSIKKWTGISVPDDFEDSMKSIADGVKAFSWAFLGSWSIDSVVGPLGDLATSIKKWNVVSVPEGIEDKLTSLANGVKSFSGIGEVSNAANSIKTISSSVKNLSGIDFKLISSNLASLFESIKDLSSVDSVSASISKFGKNLVNEMITPIKQASLQFSTVGSSIMESIVNGIGSRSQMVSSSISEMMLQMIRIVHASKGLFTTAGSSIMMAFGSGISTKRSIIAKSIESSVKSGASSIKLYYNSYYSAGSYLADGFANGISRNAFKAVAKSTAMAQAALKAAKEALGIASPSKEGYKIGDYYGLGFVNAIADYADKVYKASENMADSAKVGLADAISKIGDFISTDIDTQPTIRPVLDLTDISSGMNTLNGMLSTNSSVGVLANVNGINMMMNNRSQNGGNTDVISAIDRLRSDFNNADRTTYNINGITYDDGSNLRDAVETIIRYANIERRV